MHPLLIYIGSGWIFWGGVITLLLSCLSGIGFAGERVWSVLLDEEHPGRIENRAVPGSQVSTSRRTLEQFRFCPGDVLVIELGGNDLLGGVPGAEFRRKLDGLLGVAASFDVPVLMFELPAAAVPKLVSAGAAGAGGEIWCDADSASRSPRCCRRRVNGRRIASVDYGHEKMAAVVRRCLLFD